MRPYVSSCPLALALFATASFAQTQVGGSPSTRSDQPMALRFVDASRDAGIAAFTYSNTDHSGGVAWIDFNNDYWPDLFLTNGISWDHWLYRNNGDGTFTDVSAEV